MLILAGKDDTLHFILISPAHPTDLLYCAAIPRLIYDRLFTQRRFTCVSSATRRQAVAAVAARVIFYATKRTILLFKLV